MNRVRSRAALQCAIALALSAVPLAAMGVVAGSPQPSAPASPQPSAPASPQPSAPASPQPSVPLRPDIIVVYIDDVPPLDGRLWTEERTPNIRRWIIDRGLTFENAVDEAPLCCPARANLLSGSHTHNNGVTRNEAALFDPTVTVASELHDAGYRTAWIGKYLNRYMSLRGARREAHETAWDTFHPLSGGSYGYYHWPKGAERYRFPRQHSMRLVQDLAVRELRRAPRDQPLFAVFSSYAGHGPNIALPGFRGSPRCADIRPWKPPNYGAAASSGKPPWMGRWTRSQTWRVPVGGMPLVHLCEDMLGVDQLVGKVAAQQRARGRLEDTLLVLTSDNGYLLGEYGAKDKKLPWATDIVLSMAWPRGMGTERRTTDFPTSNIDLAPTFCAIGGCEMGPYPSGQTAADGISLVPVLRGETPPGRTALLTVMLEGDAHIGMPAWTAVTTYGGHPIGRWHYIHWEPGRRELYDLERDPLELHNVIRDPRHAKVRRRLETLLRRLLAERGAAPVATPAPSATPSPAPSFRPSPGPSPRPSARPSSAGGAQPSGGVAGSVAERYRRTA